MASQRHVVGTVVLIAAIIVDNAVGVVRIYRGRKCENETLSIEL
jgi:hypothetical protein